MTSTEVTSQGVIAALDTWSTNDVWRSDVLDLYREAADRRVVLFSAPAGYGKSVLAAQWRALDPRRASVHLRLSEADDDPALLVSHLVDCLRDDGEVAAVGGQATLDAAVRRMDARARTVVVLDDVDRVRSVASTAVLRHLLDTLPDGCQVVLVSRTDPDIGLAHLRASGELLEIRSDQLAMDLDTATLMMWSANVPMTGAMIEDLHRRTEGWPAGLAMAAHSLRIADRDEPRPCDLIGCELKMAAYLHDEVLSRQNEDVHAFLLQSSAFSEFSAELCDAVLDGPGAAGAFRSVARTHLFVVPVARRPGWFRYHHLFRELLRTELGRADPTARARLESRAAAWRTATRSPGGSTVRPAIA